MSMPVPLVLSVEDNDGDFALMEFVLQNCLNAITLHRLSDGEQAVTFLANLTASGNQTRPDLILLDINIPRKNGFDVLEFIKAQSLTRDVPVVMLTSSRDVHEKTKALALGAEEFVTKPSNLDGMLDVLSEICSKYLGGSPALI